MFVLRRSRGLVLKIALRPGLMNALYGATSMCLAYEPRMAALPGAEPPRRGAEPPRRGTGPQYFTFDPLPAASQTPCRRNPARGRKRLRKVLYPPVVSLWGWGRSRDAWVLWGVRGESGLLGSLRCGEGSFGLKWGEGDLLIHPPLCASVSPAVEVGY